MDDRYWSCAFLDAHMLHKPLQAGLSTDYGSWKKAFQAGIREHGDPGDGDNNGHRGHPNTNRESPIHHTSLDPA
jgi:hypothetical protein